MSVSDPRKWQLFAFGTLAGLSAFMLTLFHPDAAPSIPKLQAEHYDQESLEFLYDGPVFVEPKTETQNKSSRKKYEYWKTIHCLVTAYTPGPESCGPFADGKTSIGKDAWLHIEGVAADPRALPYGAMVKIPGLGYREVDDTGRAMRDNWKKKGIVHLDVRMANVTKALQWGVRELDVHVYRPIEETP